jgi:protein-disulfide isomerase
VGPPISLPTIPTGDSPGAKQAEASPEDDAAIPIEADDATWGSRLAPVTIVEFSDFQCPFCSKASGTIEELKRSYGPDKLRIVFKHYPLPFHQNARPAAEAAQGVLEIAGQGAFWAFHDLLFGNQQQLGDDAYMRFARSVGANASALRAGLDAHTWAPKVQNDEDTAKKVGVSGTPAFYINGTALSGAQPIDKFRQVIDAEAAKAQEKLTAGTSRDRLYKTLAQANFKKPVDDDDDDDVVTQDVWMVPVGSSPVRGPKSALVTIVEFGDYQCPYCKKAEATVSALLKSYGNDVRLVWKNEPLAFHPRAEPAAQAALEARAEKGDTGFWDAHDKLFAASALEDSDLLAAVQAAGVDPKKAMAAISGHKYQRQIDADTDLGDDVQANGTPHFFINGRRMVGAQPEAKFRAIIDEELKKAKAQVAAGTAAEKLYDAIIKSGKGGLVLEKKSVVPLASAPARGSGVVLIQEFADFECPYCKKAEDTLKEVLKNYPNKVKIVWRNMPLSFHSHAELAAEAAMEAQAQKGNAGFYKMHELLFAAASGLDRPALETYATQAGLDLTKFKTSLDTHFHKPAIDADAAIAQAASISGTPAFVIGPYFLNGAQPYNKFRRIIEQVLKESGAKP